MSIQKLFPSASVHAPQLHSFPTRRSSDLNFSKANRARWRQRGMPSISSRKIVPSADSTMRRCSTDRKSTRLNSSHLGISYAVLCLKKKTFQLNAQPLLVATQQ